MVTWTVFGARPRPSLWLLAVGWVALRRSWVAVVFILMARRRAVVGVKIVMMVAVWVVMVVVIVVAVIVVVVAGQTVSPATLASHWRTEVKHRWKN